MICGIRELLSIAITFCNFARGKGRSLSTLSTAVLSIDLVISRPVSRQFRSAFSLCLRRLPHLLSIHTMASVVLGKTTIISRERIEVSTKQTCFGWKYLTAPRRWVLNTIDRENWQIPLKISQQVWNIEVIVKISMISREKVENFTVFIF